MIGFFTTPDGAEGLFVALVLHAYLVRWQAAQAARRASRGRRR